jgi:hypothetical protein
MSFVVLLERSCISLFFLSISCNKSIFIFIVFHAHTPIEPEKDDAPDNSLDRLCRYCLLTDIFPSADIPSTSKIPSSNNLACLLMYAVVLYEVIGNNGCRYLFFACIDWTHRVRRTVVRHKSRYSFHVLLPVIHRRWRLLRYPFLTYSHLIHLSGQWSSPFRLDIRFFHTLLKVTTYDDQHDQSERNVYATLHCTCTFTLHH